MNLGNNFIPYEQALSLKELGFDKVCFGFYNNAIANVYIKQDFNDELREIYKGDFDAPLYQQAFRWFREKGFDFYIQYYVHTSVKYYEVHLRKEGHQYIFGKSLTHEEAELECLKKLIEIVKSI